MRIDDLDEDGKDELRRLVIEFAARMAEIEEESRARCAESGEAPTHRILLGIDLETPDIAFIPIDPPPEDG